MSIFDINTILTTPLIIVRITVIVKDHVLKLRPAAFAASLLVAGHAYAVGEGTIASGDGTINKNGATTTVNQTSDKLIINWDNMNVQKGDTLNFTQKNAASAVLNRINSASATNILGALNANGRVFIVNPNGVMIGNGAKINVGSLIASSLNISDDDFKAGRLNFKGGVGDVVNEGEINAKESIALIGSGAVQSSGTINSQGNVVLAAGDAITLQFANSGLQAQVTEGSLQALVDNRGIITTKDGDVVMTAWARDAIARSVINNTGTIEANRLNSNYRYYRSAGNVSLESIGNGEVKVGGKVKAAENVYARGAKLTQLKDAETSGKSVWFHGMDGDVTLSGKTTASQYVNVDGKNVSLDGEVDAFGLSLYADKAATTDNAKLKAYYASLTGGDFDFSRGVNKLARTMIYANSADLAYDGDAYVSGSLKGALKVRGNKNLELGSIYAGGNVDASATEDLLFGSVYSDGDVTLNGKNVKGRGYYDRGVINAGGNVTVTADNDVVVSTINGKDVTVKAKAGKADIGSVVGKGNVSLEGKTSLTVATAIADGKLDLASDGDVIASELLKSGGDLTVRGKSVKGKASTSYYGDRNPDQVARIESGGNVTVTADQDVKLGDVSGKAVDVRAKGGNLEMGKLDASENAYLQGKGSIKLNSRANAAKNLTLETEGNVTHNGLDVGGDLEYKLATASTVTNKGKASVVKGKTTGLPEGGEKMEPDAKPDDNRREHDYWWPKWPWFRYFGW
ncbi:filamentous hemagglutinin N-terminal domain-containing protein [Trinickia sp. YCB016]